MIDLGGGGHSPATLVLYVNLPVGANPCKGDVIAGPGILSFFKRVRNPNFLLFGPTKEGSPSAAAGSLERQRH
jgi:hypothetical protein